MKLRQLAHTRTGDKGDISNIAVIAYRPEDFEYLKAHLDAGRVEAVLATMFEDDGKPLMLTTKRYELPAIQALNFVIQGVLRGGVTRSLAIDAHGKSLGSLLLDLNM